jgi:hypothetical protein
MLRIDQISQDPFQRQTLVLPDGTSFTMTLYFSLLQYGWFIRELNYLDDFTIRNFRVCTLPNILRQFKNIIPFGIACFVEGNREPTQRQDFSSGAARLFILTETEVQEYEAFLSAKV